MPPAALALALASLGKGVFRVPRLHGEEKMLPASRSKLAEIGERRRL